LKIRLTEACSLSGNAVDNRSISVEDANLLLQVHRKLLLVGEIRRAVGAVRLDFEVRKLVPLEVEFVLEGRIAFATRQVLVLPHVKREMAFERKILVAMLAVENRVLSVAEIVSAVDI